MTERAAKKRPPPTKLARSESDHWHVVGTPGSLYPCGRCALCRHGERDACVAKQALDWAEVSEVEQEFRAVVRTRVWTKARVKAVEKRVGRGAGRA